MIEECEEVKEITWENLLSYWESRANVYEPQLMLPFNLKKVFVNYQNNGYFHGYDWIEINNYKERTEYVSEKPIEFLCLGTSLNKGTLHTLEMLGMAQDNQEDCAAIWLVAFTKEVLDSFPYEWRGKGYNILYKVYIEAYSKIKEKYDMWHHAMRKLLPEICFSYDFLESMNVNSYRQIVELSVINSAQILNNYIAVEYDSRRLP
jgi:hypothetical protein